MEDRITVTGRAGIDASLVPTRTGNPFVKFRLASTERKKDSADNWVDGDTNWYSIVSYGHLATNVAASIRSGDPVVVTGRLRVKDWANGQKSGTDVEIVADAIGHDLRWTTTSCARRPRPEVATEQLADGAGPTAEPEPRADQPALVGAQTEWAPAPPDDLPF